VESNNADVVNSCAAVAATCEYPISDQHFRAKLCSLCFGFYENVIL